MSIRHNGTHVTMLTWCTAGIRLPRISFPAMVMNALMNHGPLERSTTKCRMEFTWLGWNPDRSQALSAGTPDIRTWPPSHLIQHPHSNDTQILAMPADPGSTVGVCSSHGDKENRPCSLGRQFAGSHGLTPSRWHRVRLPRGKHAFVLWALHTRHV